MASIGTYSDKQGRTLHRILFVHPDGKRKTIWLGRLPKRDVESFRTRVEALVASLHCGYPPDDDTLRWISRLSKQFAKKLAGVGLIKPREPAKATPEELLGSFLDGYIGKRIADTKGATRTVYRRTRNHLVNYFGESKALAAITAGDASDFRRYLIGLKRIPKGTRVKDESTLPSRLSENTIRRTCGFARQFFSDAVDRNLIEENPFDSKSIPVAVRGNAKRSYFITAADAQKVLDACPDAQTRLVFALARYGGLRTPSETLALSWSDVDWTAGKMIVQSPKTEHHEGKESRVVPIFPELRPYLREAFDPDDEKVVTITANSEKNFRTRFTRIVIKAGLKPWPKLFHNLRASRQTELEGFFPSYVVCAWMGNSQQVARKHYLTVTDEHFSRAIESVVPDETAQKTAQQPSDLIGQDRTASSMESEKPLRLQGFHEKQAGSRDSSKSKKWTIEDSNL